MNLQVFLESLETQQCGIKTFFVCILWNKATYYNWFVDFEVCASLDVGNNFHLFIIFSQNWSQTGLHLKYKEKVGKTKTDKLFVYPEIDWFDLVIVYHFSSYFLNRNFLKLIIASPKDNCFQYIFARWVLLN